MADVVVGPDMGGVMPSGKAVPSLDQIAAGREARRDATASLPLPLFKNLELANACILLLPVQHARRAAAARGRSRARRRLPPSAARDANLRDHESARRGRLATKQTFKRRLLAPKLSASCRSPSNQSP